MKLTFTGMRNGKTTTITWEDGALSGDHEVVDWITYVAKIAEASGTIVGGVGGPYSTEDHLSDPYAAAALIRSVYPGPVTMTGELPVRFAPPDAIQ